MAASPEQHFARMQYERQAAQAAAGGGGEGTGLDAAGPPQWSRGAWEAWKAQYGEYPFSQHHMPSTLEGAPDWVFQLMGMRRPPVGITLGSAGANTSAVDGASIWGVK